MDEIDSVNSVEASVTIAYSMCVQNMYVLLYYDGASWSRAGLDELW